MYKNQLQELAQRSCFNLPSYSCIREGPDHAPKFKATVTFNGEAFESPAFYSTLRQAEHSAAQLALATLTIRGPSRALAARVLDETGVYKNLLQETAHRAGLNLPVYTTVRSGPGHVPVFSCTVELAGMSFTGEPARTKKQAQKNAALSAWSSLKTLAHCGSPSSPSMESRGDEEQEQVTVARVLGNLRRNVPNSTISLCSSSTHFQNWVYPSYPPEIAMYQLWHHQEQFLHHHQQRLFQIPISPSRPSTPPLYPFVHSVIRPDHFLYFPAAEQASVSAVPPRLAIAASNDPLRGRSTVTIREIQEEKPLEEAPSPRAAESSHRDDDQRRTATVKLAKSQARAQTWDREWASYHPRPNPMAVRTMGPTSGPTQFATAPPRMRVGSPSPSWPARPVRQSFMAPAVRIRSVVPVCSAPPSRRAEMVGPSRVDGSLLPNSERKNNEDVSQVSLELDKLHIYRERGLSVEATVISEENFDSVV